MSNSIERKLLPLLSKNSKTLILYWTGDLNEGMEFVSENVVSVLGYRSELLLSGAITLDSLIHPDDAQNQQHIFTSELFETYDDEIVHPEFRILKADGSYMWVQQTTIIQRSAVTLTNSYLGLLVDVTHLQNTKALLTDSSNRLELAISTSGVGIWELDVATGRVHVDVSWSKLMGFAKVIPAVTTDRIKAMVHADDFHFFSSSLDDFVEGRVSQFDEVVRMRHLNGEWRYMHHKGVISKRDKDGNVSKYLGSMTDITSQKQNELAAVAALSSRNQFFARVSHEIRTPMHGILGILGLLKTSISDPVSLQQIEKVVENSEQLLYLLNDVLDLAKLNETKLSVTSELTSLGEVIAQVDRLFRAKAEAKGLKFVTILPDSPQYIFIDKVRLTQILSNLVSNAIKYTHRGEVKIRCLLVNGMVKLSIIDSGIGIKDTDTIFDAYQQESAGQALGATSTGLGLEIVKKLCDLMGITISVTSSLSGTEFSLDLGKPAQASESVANDSHLEIARPENLSGKKILVVDDSELNREIACEMLKECGVTTYEASDGYEAIKALSNLPDVDVVLIDKHMPNMNGIEATKQIMLMYEAKTPPIVIALTADAFDVDNQEWFEYGLSDLITKPFDVDMLIMTISRAINKGPAV